MRNVNRAVAFASKALANIGMWLILAVGVFIVCNVILRAVGHSYQGTVQVSEFALTICVFAAVAQAWARGIHVRIEVLLRRFSPRVRFWAEILSCLLGVVLFGMIVKANIDKAIYTHLYHETTWVSNIPYFPLHIVIALGSALLIAQILITCKALVSEGRWK